MGNASFIHTRVEAEVAGSLGYLVELMYVSLSIFIYVYVCVNKEMIALKKEKSKLKNKIIEKRAFIILFYFSLYY